MSIAYTGHMKTGLFLGRFQPFHKGHQAAIRQAAHLVDTLYVGIGSAQESHTLRNPFSGAERVAMIRAATEDVANLEIVLIPDMPNQDNLWVAYLEERYPKFDLIFTGNPDTKQLFEDKGYPVVDVDMIPNVSATIVREMIIKDGDWQELVPAEVGDILRQIKGSERVKAARATGYE